MESDECYRKERVSSGFFEGELPCVIRRKVSETSRPCRSMTMLLYMSLCKDNDSLEEYNWLSFSTRTQIFGTMLFIRSIENETLPLSVGWYLLSSGLSSCTIVFIVDRDTI